MLQAAAFAIQAVNTTVPDTAPADFQAGFFMGFNNADVRDLLGECWIPDQHMADSCDAFIAAIEAKNWSTVTSTISSRVAQGVARQRHTARGFARPS